MEQIFDDVGGTVGAGLKDTLRRVMAGDGPILCHQLRAGVMAEGSFFRRQRQEFQEHMRATKDVYLLQRDLKAAKESLAKVNKYKKQADSVVTENS